MKQLLRVAALAFLLIGLVACGGGDRQPVAGRGTTTTTQRLSGSSSTTGPSTTSTTGGPTTTLPRSAASGPLSVQTTIALPISANQAAGTDAAEGPDGAVFVTDPEESIVWVVDGNGPAALAEHINGDPLALTADATSLYVATTSAVYRFARQSGDQVARWSLPALGQSASTHTVPLVSLTSAGGAVWVTVTHNLREVKVYRLDPESTNVPELVVQCLGAVVAGDGSLYYERSDDHLVRRAPDGSLTVGPALANKPNGLGGGVQRIVSVAGGQVWVDQPAGQGLDDTYTTYDAMTLEHQTTNVFGTVGATAVDSLAGPLLFGLTVGVGSVGNICSPSSQRCVVRITPGSTARLSYPVSVGSGLELLGPYPAVLGLNAAGTALELQRLSA